MKGLTDMQRTARFQCVKVVNQVGDKTRPFKREDRRQETGEDVDIRAVLRAYGREFPATLSVFGDAALEFAPGREYEIQIVPVEKE